VNEEKARAIAFISASHWAKFGVDHRRIGHARSPFVAKWVS
jgi:hypothetical protein